MTLRRHAVLGLVLSALAGCATPPAALDALMSSDRLSGRMSVQVDGTGEEPARSVIAAFELTGNAQRGRLDLSTPIGVTLARASWQPGSVSVETPQGKSQHASLADMSRQVLGEELPVAAMFDWLRGRPWPGADSFAALPDEPVGFHQLGWAVDLSKFEQSRIAARRSEPPAVVVLVRLDTE